MTVFLCSCFTAHANSHVCLEEKLDPDRALFIAWGDPTLSKDKAVWDFPAYISKRPERKTKLMSISSWLFENINKRVVSLPDKLLNIPSDNSTLILLVSTTPFETEYGCVACAPLLGAQLWHKQDNSWCLIAEDRAITFMGGIGELTYDDVKVVKVGMDKWGVLIEDDVGFGGANTHESTLLLPTGKGFLMAFDEVTGDGYQGDDTSYFNYNAKIDFVPGQNRNYYDLRVVTSGTNRNKKGREIQWNREKLYIMNNGRYILKLDRPIIIKKHSKN